jgi:hypothetical protein
MSGKAMTVGPESLDEINDTKACLNQMSTSMSRYFILEAMHLAACTEKNHTQTTTADDSSGLDVAA